VISYDSRHRASDVQWLQPGEKLYNSASLSCCSSNFCNLAFFGCHSHIISRAISEGEAARIKSYTDSVIIKFIFLKFRAQSVLKAAKSLFSSVVSCQVGLYHSPGALITTGKRLSPGVIRAPRVLTHIISTHTKASHRCFRGKRVF
jgi:hypothetical protein